MKIYTEKSLCDFQPWLGAVSFFTRLKNLNLLEQLESILEDAYPNGLSETEINDLLWFDEEAICYWLGIPAYGED